MHAAALCVQAGLSLTSGPSTHCLAGLPVVNVQEPAPTSAESIVLALAVWLVISAPQWGLLLRGMRSLDRIRRAVARGFGWKLLAAGSWTAALSLPMIGTVLVCRDLLGPERLGAQYILASATLVQEALLIVVAVILVARRHRAGGGAPAPGVRR